MLARLISAFQVSDDKIYNVGSHVSILEILEVKDPGKVFSTKVLGKELMGPRQRDTIYMFLSVDGALKSYTFKQPLRSWSFAQASNLKEEDFMAGHHKAPLVKQCLENMHDLILQTIVQMKTTTELIAATAGTIMIKEKARDQEGNPPEGSTRISIEATAPDQDDSHPQAKESPDH